MKCEHSMVFLFLDPGPNVRACVKCLKYQPDPHPKICKEEIHMAIEFAKHVAGQKKDKEAARAKDQSISEKVAHVKKSKQTRSHECHWTGCKQQVPPAMYMCKHHWFRLPKNMRDRIWATYRTGQEDTMTPSEAYIHVSRQVQEWVDAQEML